MLGDQLCHLEHIDHRLATEDFLEIGVGIDIALVCFVLEFVGFDVDPEFLYDF